MRVAGTARLAAAPDRVMEVVVDPARFADTLPGVGTLDWDLAEDGSFAAVIRPAIALGEVPIRTTWRPELLGASAVHYTVEGRTDEQRITLGVTLELRSADGGTEAEWAVDVAVTGTLRSAGQRTIGAVVAAQARGVLAAVDAAAVTSGPASA